MNTPQITLDTLIQMGVEVGYTPEYAEVVALQCITLDREAEKEDMSDLEEWL